MILNTLFIESLSNFAHGISSAFFIYFGINLVFFLQSVIAPVPALVFSLSRGVVISLVLLYVLPAFMGMDGILWAMVAAEVLTIAGTLPYTLHMRKAG